MFGSTIVAVTDSKGGIYDPNGLDIAAVNAHKMATKSVVGYNGLKTLTNDEVMALPVDVIIAAAPDEGAINEKVAPTVKAKVICELRRLRREMQFSTRTVSMLSLTSCVMQAV